MLLLGFAYAGLVLHLANTPVQTQPDSIGAFGNELTGNEDWLQTLNPAPAIQHGLKIKRPDSDSNFGIEPFH